MAIEVEVTGTGRFMGDKSNVVNYTYNEGSTPLVPGDDSGPIGDVSIDVVDDSNSSILLYKDDFLLRDDFHGSVVGSIESVSGSNGVITMGGRSKLALLNVEKIIAPRRGEIGDILEAIMNDCGITTNIVLDAQLSTDIVNVPGYEGDVWVYVKRLCAAHEVEVTIIRDYVVIRPARQRLIDSTDLIEKNWQLQDITLAQEFDVAYYNYSQETDYLVYPEGGWTPDVQVYSVGADETVVFEIPIDFYLTSINQPTVADSVSKTYVGPDSRYAVSGNDGLPIPAAQWIAYGGDMSFAIKGDGSIIEVTLTGMNFPDLAPFTIGLSDGSTSYSTLRITGDGMNFDRQIYTAKTGLTAADTPVVNGGEIDNQAIDTLEDAKKFALYARRLYSLPVQTYQTSTRTFERLAGSVPTIFYPTFEEFAETLTPGYSFSNFNSDYAADTFESFTVDLGNTVPQGFGEVAGSRIQLDDAMYRVRTVNITPDTVSIDAEYDTLFYDFDSVYDFLGYIWSALSTTWSLLGGTWSTVVYVPPGPKTFEDFNDIFDGVTFNDFALLPMREEALAIAA